AASVKESSRSPTRILRPQVLARCERRSLDNPPARCQSAARIALTAVAALGYSGPPCAVPRNEVPTVAKRIDRTAPAGDAGIDVLLREKRIFRPSAAFRRQANVSDPRVYRRAARNPDAFWASIA